MRPLRLRLLFLLLSSPSLLLLAQWNGIDPSTPLDGIDPGARASIFVYYTPAVGRYVFALNAVAETGDLFVHMAAPSRVSWMGVGVGPSMPDAFMFVSYPAADRFAVTTSPRRADGHSEPAYIGRNPVQLIYSDSYGPNSNTVDPGGVQIAHFVCRNCSALASLDLTSRAQPFLFALGPDGPALTASDALDAPLPRHAWYGHFTMDMVQATSPSTSYGRVPAPNVQTLEAVLTASSFATTGASTAYGVAADRDPWPLVHAAVMGLAFLLIFPAGALVLRGLRSLAGHAAVQSLGLSLVVTGLAAGLKVSSEYNKTKSLSCSHQILGLLVVALLGLQLGLGLVHHAIYRRRTATEPHDSSATAFGRAHRFLGPTAICLALINAGLGFDLAGDASDDSVYALVVVALGVLFVGARVWVGYRGQAKISRQGATGEPLAVYEPRFSDVPYGHEYSVQEDERVQIPLGPYTWKETARVEDNEWPRA